MVDLRELDYNTVDLAMRSHETSAAAARSLGIEPKVFAKIARKMGVETCADRSHRLWREARALEAFK